MQNKSYNSNKLYILIGIVVIIVSLALIIKGPPKPEMNEQSFTVIYTSNLQGRLLEPSIFEKVEKNRPADFSMLYPTLEKLRTEGENRQEPVFFFDLGNSLTGDQDLSRLMMGIPMERLMKEVPYSALLFGKNEYMMRHDILKKLSVSFDFFGMNAHHKNKRLMLVYLDAFKVLEKSDLKVGVLGYYIPDKMEEERKKKESTGEKTGESDKMQFKNLGKFEDFVFEDNPELINKTVKTLDADIIILLASVPDVIKLSNEVEGIDLIITGGFDKRIPPDRICTLGKTPIAPFVDSRFDVGELRFSRKGKGEKWEITALVKEIVPSDAVLPGGILNVLLDARQNLEISYKGLYTAIYNQFNLWMPDKPDKNKIEEFIGKALLDYTGAHIVILDRRKISIPGGNVWGTRGILDLPGKSFQAGIFRITPEELKKLREEKKLAIVGELPPDGGYGIADIGVIKKWLKTTDEISTMKNPANYIILDYFRANRGKIYIETGGYRELEQACIDIDNWHYRYAANRIDRIMKVDKKKNENLELFRDCHMLLGQIYFKNALYDKMFNEWSEAYKCDYSNKSIMKLLMVKPEVKEEPPPAEEQTDNQTTWNKFRGNSSNDGLSPFEGPEKHLLRWKFASEGAFIASPVIGKDGTIYIGGENTVFYAISPQGDKKWSVQCGMPIRSTACLDHKENIYFGCDDSHLYSLDKTGRLRWKFKGGFFFSSSPAIGRDGTIYAGNEDFVFYAINPDGTEKWRYKTGGIIHSSAAIGPDGTIYVGSEDHHLYAFEPDGQLKWRFETGHKINGSPAVGPDGTIYVGSEDRYLYAINPDGSRKWKTITGNFITSSPAVSAEGNIIIGSEDKNIYSISSSGEVQWTYKTKGEIISTPLLDVKGNIYIGSDDGNLYALTAEGEEKWVFLSRDPIMSSPALSSNRTIFVGSEDRNLYAIGAD